MIALYMKKVREWEMNSFNSFHFSVCLSQSLSEKRETAASLSILSIESASTLSVFNDFTDNVENRSEDIEKGLIPHLKKSSVRFSSNTPCIIKGASITRRLSTCPQVEDVESIDPLDDTGDGL